MKILSDVIQDKNLSYLDKCIFTTLITFNGKGFINPSLNAISVKLNCNSRNNISVSLNKLKRAGYINIKRRYQKSSIYELRTDLIKENPKPKEIILTDIPISLTEKQQNKSILFSVVSLFAKLHSRKYESSDYAFINKVLGFKKNDNLCYLSKCLMLCYILKHHKNKIENSKYKGIIINSFKELSYTDFRKSIFNTNTKQQTTSEIQFIKTTKKDLENGNL